MHDYAVAVRSHYASFWQASPVERKWTRGPIHELDPDFSVLEFARGRSCTYATCAMSSDEDDEPLELHLLSPFALDAHVELLTVIAHYHRTGSPLGLHHTVNFGRPWIPGSRCDHGLISLPYLDGPRLEWMRTTERTVRFLWLIPITAAERDLKRDEGVEALESRFEERRFNYLDPGRPSVV